MIPEKLVAAAARGIYKARHVNNSDEGFDTASGGFLDDLMAEAQSALTAAFAALPECEEAVNVMGSRRQMDSLAVLNALARMADADT